VRSLPAPIYDSVLIYDSIVKEKRRFTPKRLKKIRTDVHDAYRSYMAHSYCLEKLAPITILPLHVKSLIHAYVTETKSMRSLRADLLKPDLDDFAHCPYCGINEPRTLDHYIPKESHPEFSIFPLNLIPICNQCNSTYKGVKFLSAGKRIFLHSYLDAFPDFYFVVADISIGTKIEINFKIESNPAYLEFSRLLAEHFNCLNLNDRFKYQASVEIKVLRSSLHRIYQVNSDFSDVAQELNQEADDLKKVLGKNHWKVALFRGLARSREYCDGGYAKLIK
jgi:hypothetical protein